MGRELKRVALDFQWPIGRVWEGFVNEAARQTVPCPHCKDGYTPEAAKLRDRWYGKEDFRPEDRGSTPFLPSHPQVDALARRHVEQNPRFYGRGEDAVAREARRLCELFNCRWSHHLDDGDVAALVAEGRLKQLTHEWSDENGWQPRDGVSMPTAEQVNAWSLTGLAHDSSNRDICVEADCMRRGIDPVCGECKGQGWSWVSDEAQAMAEDWEETEPPVGPGYQMWETVTEGSPISPVFATPIELAQWLAANRGGSVDDGTSVKQWMDIITGPEWAPTAGLGGDGVLRTGSQMMGP